LLTSCLQKTLAIDTDPAVLAASHDVTNTYTIVSGVQNNVVNIPALFSDNHRSALKSAEDMRGQSRVVSTIRTVPVVEQPFMPA